MSSASWIIQRQKFFISKFVRLGSRPVHDDKRHASSLKNPEPHLPNVGLIKLDITLSFFIHPPIRKQAHERNSNQF